MIHEIDLLSDSPDNKAVPDSPALATISALAEEWDLLTRDLARLGMLVLERTKRKTEIEKEAMPSAMEMAGVSSFVAKNGRSIKVEEIVNGNIPADSTIEKARGEEKNALIARRAAALAVINEKWPGLMKTKLSLSFAPSEAEVALSIAELIREQFKLEAAIDKSIHPATLNSHFKELKEQGKLGDIPIEPFNLYIGPYAKIK